jgi:signal transduction histidine kinase
MSTPAQAQTHRLSVRAISVHPTYRPSGARLRDHDALATVAHDARNVLASLRLYCDLLAEPGIFVPGREHFAAELCAVAAAGSRLVEQLASLRGEARTQSRTFNKEGRSQELPIEEPISDLAQAVRELAGPLAALAGANINFEMECLPCVGRVHLSQEELTRILINLTRNAAEAMPQGGRIRVTLQLGDGGSFLGKQAASRNRRTALLCVQDAGPGVPDAVKARIFEAGFSTKKSKKTHVGPDRGLGLSIVRSLAESAGGSVRVVSTVGRGARFEVELPLIASTDADHGFLADFLEKEHVQC